LKIRGKINLLVSVMAGVALVIGATALFAMNEYNNKLTAYESASSRAYAGERLNRFVTAVVMEARGIYAAKDVKDVAPFAKGIATDLDEIDKVIASWAPLVPDSQKDTFSKLVDRSKEFRT
jgi:methyl-accepting chemotaxis protein